MKTGLMLLVLAASFGLVYVTYRNSKELARQQQTLAQIAEKLSQTSSIATLDEQERCAKQSAVFYRYFMSHASLNASTTNYSAHYNKKLGHCYVEVQSFSAAKNSTTVIKSVSDAFENTVLANYVWANNQGKKYWEVKPSMCIVDVPSGEERHCESDDAFEAAIKVYMD